MKRRERGNKEEGVRRKEKETSKRIQKEREESAEGAERRNVSFLLSTLMGRQWMLRTCIVAKKAIQSHDSGDRRVCLRETEKTVRRLFFHFQGAASLFPFFGPLIPFIFGTEGVSRRRLRWFVRFFPSSSDRSDCMGTLVLPFSFFTFFLFVKSMEEEDILSKIRSLALDNAETHNTPRKVS